MITCFCFGVEPKNVHPQVVDYTSTSDAILVFFFVMNGLAKKRYTLCPCRDLPAVSTFCRPNRSVYCKEHHEEVGGGSKSNGKRKRAGGKGKGKGKGEIDEFDFVVSVVVCPSDAIAVQKREGFVLLRGSGIIL